MSLIEYTLDGKIDKVQQAIERLKAFEPEDGYIVADSGGKDSTCVYALAKMAGVKHEPVYSVTSVDPPELVRFIKKNHPDTRFQHSHYADGKVKTMFTLIRDHKILPTRLIRYCCADLKEQENKGRLTVTGVRWAESINRKKNQALVSVFGETKKTKKKGHIIYNDDNDEARRMVETCYRTRKTLVNPIIDWTDEDVWEFIKTEHLPYCELYDCGFKRLGCIGCPMSTKAEKTRYFERYPKIKENYLRAIKDILPAFRLGRENKWTEYDVFDWWIGDKLIEEESDIDLFTEYSDR